MSSFNTTVKEMNEKHAGKQVTWEVQYEKPQVVCYSCCLPFNYWSLKALANPPMRLPQASGNTPNPLQSAPSLANSLKELSALHDQGALSDEEYAAAKAKLLNK